MMITMLYHSVQSIYQLSVLLLLSFVFDLNYFHFHKFHSHHHRHRRRHGGGGVVSHFVSVNNESRINHNNHNDNNNLFVCVFVHCFVYSLKINITDSAVVFFLLLSVDVACRYLVDDAMKSIPSSSVDYKGRNYHEYRYHQYVVYVL